MRRCYQEAEEEEEEEDEEGQATLKEEDDEEGSLQPTESAAGALGSWLCGYASIPMVFACQRNVYLRPRQLLPNQTSSPERSCTYSAGSLPIEFVLCACTPHADVRGRAPLGQPAKIRLAQASE